MLKNYSKKFIFFDKEKKILRDLESQTDKLAKEFYTYCMRAAEAPFKRILSDEEASKKFEEVKDMVSSAMDILTRAVAEESTAEDEAREKIALRKSSLYVGGPKMDMQTKVAWGRQ